MFQFWTISKEYDLCNNHVSFNVLSINRTGKLKCRIFPTYERLFKLAVRGESITNISKKLLTYMLFQHVKVVVQNAKILQVAQNVLRDLMDMLVMELVKVWK